jgi:hypothetical protein
MRPMRHTLLALPASLLILAGSASAQPQACSWPDLKASAQNLSFADGPVATAPAGWMLGPEWFMPTHEPVYEALIAPANQCHGSQKCATVHALRNDPSVPLSFLYQDLDASLYRGQTLTYRASVRVDPGLGSVARLLVRVHRKDYSTTFRDDLGNHPVTSGDWATYEIHAPIATDAYHIEFGLQLIGRGAVWVDQISTAFAPAR